MRRCHLLIVLLVASVAANDGLETTDDAEEYEEVELRVQQEQQASTNPCNVHKCQRGETCVLAENGEPLCVCKTCDSDPEDVKVCSTTKVTYASECALDRDHCLCRRQEDGCHHPGVAHVRLDYFAECKELSECPANELGEFPQRMQDWLFRIMRDMVNKEEEADEEIIEMVEEARADDHHAAAVIWKFCALDIHPLDRKVTQRELMYIIASIKPMEHCLVPFLNSCDANSDNSIDFVEWAACLGIGHDKIEVQCEIVHKQRG